MRVSLRRQLLSLAIAGILPLAILAGAGLYLLYQQHRGIEQRRGLEITRALATAVEAELARSMAALQIIAESRSLDGGDLASFRDVALRSIRTQPHWRFIMLLDPAGTPLVNTREPEGAPIPPLRERGSFDEAVRAKAPVVGYLAKGAQTYAFPLRVPVMRGGELRYVVTAVVEPEAMVELLRKQAVPEDWVLSVFDARGNRVARSRAHEKYIGTPPSPDLGAMMAREAGREGMGITRALEGDEIITAFTRLPQSGWSVAIGVPVAAVNEAALRSVAVYALAVLVSILVALAAAYVVARRISRPMGELRDAAQIMGQGGEPAIPESNIREVHEVGVALAEAARRRRAVEAERELLLDREKLARSQAEAANRAKDQFLAMLGHELRNPLAALSNAASLLEAEGGNERITARARDVIRRQVTHLGRLTDDLLDAARALLGKIELRMAPVDLAAVAGQALATLTATGRGGQHRFVTRLGKAWVMGDAVRLDQVVTNLLVNAVKYTPPGGTITVETRRDGADSVVNVSDTGAGLSPELAERVFDLFVQGERELDRAHGGLGIGLTLVRRLAELHGGLAMVYSEGENRGSLFSVRIPAISAMEAVQETAPAPAAAAQCSVLIVEDNDDARETLQAVLELHGHRVETASDGVTGLEKALAIAPDVALVDLGLPGIDGLELARRYRAASRERTYLVALTGYGAREDRDRALAAGFDDHVTKPVDPAKVAELVAARGAGAKVPNP